MQTSRTSHLTDKAQVISSQRSDYVQNAVSPGKSLEFTLIFTVRAALPLHKKTTIKQKIARPSKMQNFSAIVLNSSVTEKKCK